jgi:hypothetical protein
MQDPTQQAENSQRLVPPEIPGSGGGGSSGGRQGGPGAAALARRAAARKRRGGGGGGGEGRGAGGAVDLERVEAAAQARGADLSGEKLAGRVPT